MGEAMAKEKDSWQQQKRDQPASGRQWWKKSMDQSDKTIQTLVTAWWDNWHPSPRKQWYAWLDIKVKCQWKNKRMMEFMMSNVKDKEGQRDDTIALSVWDNRYISAAMHTIMLCLIGCYVKQHFAAMQLDYEDTMQAKLRRWCWYASCICCYACKAEARK